MKKLKTVVVCLVILLLLYNHVSNIAHDKDLLLALINWKENNLQQLVQESLWWLTDLFTVTCGFLFLLSPSVEMKDRFYSLLRFVCVISAFFYLPNVIYSWFRWDAYVSSQKASEILIYVAVNVIWVFCSIALLLSKPVKSIQKINLSNYELVNYTSTGHRFLHYLLDLLFLLPVAEFWAGYLPGFEDSPLGLELMFVPVYFLYCFIAEAIFRQTFGKLITRSCIVSNGANLSTSRVFKRTLSRLIPFDKLSFLFGGNWHDRVSSTSVVYIDSWQKVFDEPPVHPTE